jgi:thiamine pyrophosphokinase
MTRILIFANGELPNLESAHRLLQPDDFILCADGGTRHALALGLTPDLIIGDLDSLPPTIKHQPSTQIIQFPKDKDETDLELAINHALTLNPSEIVIIAALGGRIDQTLGNISLFADPRLSAFVIKLNDGAEEVFFCRDHAQVKGRSGDIVSLIPWGRDVTGVVTENLRWKLSSETLYPHKTRGISNEMLTEEASIKIESGLLLVVHRLS